MSCEIQPARQPTKREPIEPARPICAQESIFWAKFGRFGAKKPDFYQRKQKLWYPHKGKTIKAHWLHCFLVGHGTKWARKANIWPKMTKMFILGQIWPFLGIHISEAKNADPGIYSFVYGRFALHRKCLVCEGLTFACSALPWSKKLLRWTFLGKKFRKQPTN